MPRRRPNLLVFAIDSLRADHCSAYGYRRPTTPVAERLAAHGVLFRNHVSAYIPTTPAYTTILTGRDVMAHQMVSLSPKGPIDPALPTLPELLREFGGYRSIRIGFGGDFFRGFDSWQTYDEGWRAWPDRPARKAENLNAVAIPALESLVRDRGPWLLFIRHMDPHAPYLPPPPFDTLYYGGDPADGAITDTMGPVRGFPNFADFHLSWMPPDIRDIKHPIAMYDGAVTYMDLCIGAILNRLDELGETDNTLVVWTADHGETLDEHGCYFDHHGLYEPTLHVPLILSHPGRLPEGKVVAGYTLHQDLMPTLLEYAGLKTACRSVILDGRSALPLVEGDRPTNYTEFYLTECTWMRKRGWRTPEWKLIEAMEPDFHQKPPVELYNLVADPLEKDNLAEREPGIIRALRERMLAWITVRRRHTGQPDPIRHYRLGLDKSIGSIAVAQELQSR